MASPQSVPYKNILKSLKEGNIAPVYILHGEEGYFIDVIAKAFEEILPEADREFNQYVLYAPENEPEQIANLCRRIPMMADRQVIILKEAQAIPAAKLNKLHTYIADPVASTVLVICCRGAVIKGKDILSAAKKGGAVVFESPRIKEWNIVAYINEYIREKGLGTDDKASEMLRDFVGTDLSRLYNEIDKLAVILPRNATVTPEVIEHNIGISRDFNTFELVNALAERDPVKTFRILAYFRANPKAAPSILVIASIFNFFANLLTAFYTMPQTNDALSAALGVKPAALRNYHTAMQRYNAVQTVEIISAIRDCDIKIKGVESRTNEHDLLKELAYHILSATGRL